MGREVLRQIFKEITTENVYELVEYMNSQHRKSILYMPIIIKLRIAKGKIRSNAARKKRPTICKEKEPDYQLIFKPTKVFSVTQYIKSIGRI